MENSARIRDVKRKHFKIVALAVGGIFLFLVLLWLILTPLRQRTCQTYLSQAQNLPPKEAGRILAKAIGLCPSKWRGYFELGKIAFYQQKFTDAEKLFRIALSLNPSCLETRAWWAHALISLGKTEKAKKQIEKVLRLEPLNPLAKFALARIYLKNFDFKKAWETFPSASALSEEVFQAYRDLVALTLFLIEQKDDTIQTELRDLSFCQEVKESKNPIFQKAKLASCWANLGEKEVACKLIEEVKHNPVWEKVPFKESFTFCSVN
ncbi:tetratricopeptide repeat protein [bacterium]|nr:tetratricopeptide repeat protein [bacterium]